MLLGRNPDIIHEPLPRVVKAVLATRITWPKFLRPLFFLNCFEDCKINTTQRKFICFQSDVESQRTVGVFDIIFRLVTDRTHTYVFSPTHILNPLLSTSTYLS